jgi:hypothetical protein
MNTEQHNLPFSEFLTYLTRQGFIIGVDHHIRLQTVLNTLGQTCPPGELKYILCPLFATNAKQQQQFYRAFDTYFTMFKPEHSEKTELLRYIRDNVLTRSPEGQEIIRLYYEWSPDIVKAMEADPAFKVQLKEMIDRVLELIGGGH